MSRPKEKPCIQKRARLWLSACLRAVFNNRVSWFVLLSSVLLPIYWAVSSHELPSWLYPYLLNEYVLFLQIFAKMPLSRFIFLTEYKTYFTRKHAPRLRLVLFVLLLVSFSLVFVGVAIQSLLIFRLAVLGGILSIGGLFMMPQIYYALKISERDIGLDARESLVNSLMFYLPFQMLHWTSFFRAVFSDYVMFPFVKVEYQPILWGGILAICLYVILIDIPFWRGQKVSRKSRLAEKNEKRQSILTDLQRISDTSNKQNLFKKISHQLEILILENEIEKIESEPLHPYKGALSPLSILIGALISPIVEWVLRVLAF